MNKDRLLRLADLLEADAANPNGVKFDLGFWGIASSHADLSYEDREFRREAGEGWKEGQTVSVDCGTAACAFGLAAISGVFKDEGLSYEITHCGDLMPKYGDDISWVAAEKFFDIMEREVYALFSTDDYHGIPTKGADGERAVAARIRAFVDGTFNPVGNDDEPEDDY